MKAGQNAQHLLTQTLPLELSESIAGLTSTGKPGTPERAVPQLRTGVPAYVTDRLGIDTTRDMTEAELAHVISGKRADGQPVEGKAGQKTTDLKKRLAYGDFTFSADKSVSVAWAFASPVERAILVQAHREAVESTLEYIEKEFGFARKGKGGADGADPGHMFWIKVDHYTSRPTLNTVKNENGDEELVVSQDDEANTGQSERLNIRLPGDPNLHTHCVIPNFVITKDGRVGSIDLNGIRNRRKEFGAVYHAFLATNLRRSGIEVKLDPSLGSARLSAIPTKVRSAFSKMSSDAYELARSYAKNLGADWDNMAPKARWKLLKIGANVARRNFSEDDVADVASWREKAEALRWEYRSIVNTVSRNGVPEKDKRLTAAYDTAMPYLERQFRESAVIPASEARIAAARGLIAHGIEHHDDIGAVTKMMRERGVVQSGKVTELLWATRYERDGGRKVYVTTGLHVEQEKELIRLAKEAASDTSQSLTLDDIRAGMHRTGLDFSSDDHRLNQRTLMEHLGTGGSLAVGIGVAGSGKSTLLRPLVNAWKEKGYSVYGAAIAWRQADDLIDAGIEKDDLLALETFTRRVKSGRLVPDRNTVVVIDELGLVGKKTMLTLLELRAAFGFKLVAVGDEKQCQSIDAGPTIEIMRQALGHEQVPELLTTIRQETEREREISLAFRNGKAEEALAKKREDGTVLLVPGGYRDAIRRVAELRDERIKANAHDPNFTITVSAPTNAQARALSAAIREKRREAGEVGPDVLVVKAQDQHGATYDLPLAVGDRVRLFDRVNASFGKTGGAIGNNGSVVEIVALDENFVTMKSAKGNVGRVKWETLRASGTRRVRLSYGDAGTIFSLQGITSTEHIDAMPRGSSTLLGYTAYVAESRHRRKAWMVTSEGLERQEIIDNRGAEDTRPVTTKDIFENMARNLSRQPERMSALDFLRASQDLRRKAIHAKLDGLVVAEQREAEGKPPFTLAKTFQQHREFHAVGLVVEQVQKVSRILEEFNRAQREFRNEVEDIPYQLEEALEGVSEDELRRAMGIGGDELPPPPDWGDEAPAAPQAKPAMWANKDHDIPVTFLSVAGAGPDGREYAKVQSRWTDEQIAEARASVKLSDVIAKDGVRFHRSGHELNACCPFHNEKTASFYVDDKKGVGNCFGCGWGGDYFTYMRDMHNIGFNEAMRELTGEREFRPREPARQAPPVAEEKPEWKAVFPVPEGVPPLMQRDGRTARVFNPKRAGTPKEWGSYRPVHVASYQDAAGQQAGYVIRVEIRDQDGGKNRKFTPQVTWIVPADAPRDADPVKVGRWALWPMDDPRPLFHAEKLAQLPDAPVIVVTGEKKTDALQSVMGDRAVVVSWAGGDSARRFVDFSPLAGRDVTVWPDADESGMRGAVGEFDPETGVVKDGACSMIEQAGAAKVSLVVPPKWLPKGWDCGDLVAQRGGIDSVREFLREHRQTYDKARHKELERERVVQKRQAEERRREVDNGLSL